MFFSMQGLHFPQAGRSQSVPGPTSLVRTGSQSVLLRATATALSIRAGTGISVAGRWLRPWADQPVTLGTLIPGTDYAVFACADGTYRAGTAFSAPSGYSAQDSRLIGGFHVDLAGSICEHSLWDLHWRPACVDPRGMVLVAGRFWADIYLLGTDHAVNGTSRAGATIADSQTPPKVPATFGGTGGNYAGFNWWEAGEVLTAHGKRLPTYTEFAALAFGVTEGASIGADAVTTQRQSGRTSAWGVEQAAGVMWVWGATLSYWPSTGAAGYRANTGGRGSLYLANDRGIVAAIHGGTWNSGVNAGSRSIDIAGDPWTGAQSIGARGVADHVNRVEILP